MKRRPILTRVTTLAFGVIVAGVILLGYHVPFTVLSRTVTPTVIATTPMQMMENVTFETTGASYQWRYDNYFHI